MICKSLKLQSKNRVASIFLEKLTKNKIIDTNIRNTQKSVQAINTSGKGVTARHGLANSI